MAQKLLNWVLHAISGFSEKKDNFLLKKPKLSPQFPVLAQKNLLSILKKPHGYLLKTAQNPKGFLFLRASELAIFINSRYNFGVL